MTQVAAAPSTIRVGIVDEFPAHVRGVATALGAADRIDVAFLASSGGEARALIDADAPDILIIEPWMRSGDGLELIAWVVEEYPDVAVIALSRMWDSSHVDEATAAGVRAHLPKDTPTEDLPTIIRHVNGGAVMRPAAPARSTQRPMLTARERDVVRLLAAGLKNSQIAKELYVTEQTVKFHVRNIFRKLGVDTRTQAAYQAARLGIVS